MIYFGFFGDMYAWDAVLSTYYPSVLYHVCVCVDHFYVEFKSTRVQFVIAD